MKNNDQIINEANAIEDSFMRKLANINIKHAAAIPVALGFAVLLAGVGVEVNHQANLLEQSYGALNDYLYYEAASYSPSGNFNDYLLDSLKGDVPLVGAKVQAAGISLMTYVAAASATVAIAVKSITNIYLYSINKMKRNISEMTNIQSIEDKTKTTDINQMINATGNALAKQYLTDFPEIARKLSFTDGPAWSQDKKDFPDTFYARILMGNLHKLNAAFRQNVTLVLIERYNEAINNQQVNDINQESPAKNQLNTWKKGRAEPNYQPLVRPSLS